MTKGKRKTGGGRRRQVRGDGDPVRSCVGCRRAADKRTLLRFVRAPDGALAFDVASRIEGRGAYTCANPSCLLRAADRGGFKRAFDASVLIDSVEMSEEVLKILDGVLLQDLGIARRLGELISGRTDTLAAVGRGGEMVIGASHDLAERSRREVEKELQSRGLRLALLPSKDAVGRAIGRRATGIIGLKNSRVARRVARNCQRRLRFAEPSLDKSGEKGVLHDGEKGRMPISSSRLRDTEGVH